MGMAGYPVYSSATGTWNWEYFYVLCVTVMASFYIYDMWKGKAHS